VIRDFVSVGHLKAAELLVHLMKLKEVAGMPARKLNLVKMISTTTDSFSFDPGAFEDPPLPADSIPPWANPPSSLMSPEEDATPIPSLFYTQFYEEDVLDLIDKNVRQEFLAAVPQLNDFMHSDL
jgi:hypothetical protein